ncbi:MAG: flagellar motor switch protein FliG [Paracoccaceae bacterium]|nr:flagellar motor switch protein FliG [Paracoccaceae bacterium]
MSHHRPGDTLNSVARTDITANVPAAYRPTHLSRRQKAAIVVRLALAGDSTLTLTDLPQVMQIDLAHQLAAIRQIDRNTMLQVVEEFLSELENAGMNFPGALDNALHLLDGRINPQAVQTLRLSAGLGSTTEPWERIAALDPPVLAEILLRESTEVGAIILSKLAVPTAAAALGALPGETARRIVYDMTQTENVKPETIAAIGAAIQEDLNTGHSTTFTTGPAERAGSILNQSTRQARDTVLNGLAEIDKEFASAVRRAIFTFSNIPDRIDPKDVPKILRDVDRTALVAAFVGASGPDEKSVEFILANMSKRMAEQLREEMTEAGKVRPEDAEEAMSTIVAAIKELEAAGEIYLSAGDE